MLERFFPDAYVSSSYDIDYEYLYQKGYRGLIYDIDNTLVEHGKPANDRAIALFQRLKDLGFQCCLLSNNKEERVATFNGPIRVHTLHKAGKPGRKGYLKAMEIMHTTTENTLFIGDQLFTDIWGAKRVGISNILVKPIDKKEEIQIVCKRLLEKIVLREYSKQGRDQKEWNENF